MSKVAKTGDSPEAARAPARTPAEQDRAAVLTRTFPYIAISIFAAMVGLGVLVPILPIYARDLRVSGLEIGIIYGAYSVSRAVFMPVFGWLSDRRGRKIFLTIGLATSAVVSLGYIFAKTTETLTIVRLFHGMFTAMILPIATAYVGELSPLGEEGRWMGYFNTAFLIGFGAGPLLGGIVSDHLGMNMAFVAMAVLNLIACIIVAAAMSEQKGEKTRHRPESSFKAMGKSGTVQGLFAYHMFSDLVGGAFLVFLPIFAVAKLRMDMTLIGLLLAVYMFLMSGMQAYTGKLADRFNRRTLLIASSGANFLLIAMLPLSTAFWHLLALMVLRSVLNAVSMPIISAVSVEEGRKFGMGSTTSILGMASSAGIAIGPVIGGAVSDTFNVEAVFLSLAVLGILGVVLFATLGRRSKPETTPPPG